MTSAEKLLRRPISHSRVTQGSTSPLWKDHSLHADRKSRLWEERNQQTKNVGIARIKGNLGLARRVREPPCCLGMRTCTLQEGAATGTSLPSAPSGILPVRCSAVHPDQGLRTCHESRRGNKSPLSSSHRHRRYHVPTSGFLMGVSLGRHHKDSKNFFGTASQ